MTHDSDTTLNAEVSSSPANKKIWTTPVVLPINASLSHDGHKGVEGPESDFLSVSS